jgi:mitochondrial GTPase 1
VLPPGAKPTQDIDEFLDVLARRLGMLGRGGVRDTQRAADWFVRWWREDGALLSARAPLALDEETRALVSGDSVDSADPVASAIDSDTPAPSAVDPNAQAVSTAELDTSTPQRRGWGFDIEWTESPGDIQPLQARMEAAIDAFTLAEEEERADGGGVSARQEKLQEKAVKREKSAARVRALLAARKGAGGGGSKKDKTKRRR